MTSSELPPLHPHRRPWARGAALLIALVTFANLGASLWIDRFDANSWWIDLRALNHPFDQALLLVTATLLLAFAVKPPTSAWRRRATGGSALALALIALLNTGTYWRLLATGHIVSGAWLPFSLAPAALLAWIGARAWTAGRVVDPTPRRTLLMTTATAALLGGAGTLALILTFARTDYRRDADAVVVFGARAYADGTPSTALYDRIRTAAQLVRDGWARTLVVSGGPGDGAYHETDVMRRCAIAAGVPPQAILIDHDGVSTRATVENTVVMFRARGIRSVLAVSHGYHLARIKLAYQRHGIDAFTVPAEESRRLRKMPWFVAREAAAMVVYWARCTDRDA